MEEGLDVVSETLEGGEHRFHVLGVEFEGDLEVARRRVRGNGVGQDPGTLEFHEPGHLREGEVGFGHLDDHRTAGMGPRRVLGEELEDLASANAAEEKTVPNDSQDVDFRPNELGHQVVEVGMGRHLHRRGPVQGPDGGIPIGLEQDVLVQQPEPLLPVNQGQVPHLETVHHGQHLVHRVGGLDGWQILGHQSLGVHGVNLAFERGTPRAESFRKVRMTRLSVNVNKVATLRNARGGSVPDVVLAAVRIQEWGAHGITVHPRPDARHITYADVRALRRVVHTEFNVEGYPSPDFLDLVLEVVPEQVTLVPDPPDALTSQAGWKAGPRMDALAPVVEQLRRAGIRTSLFVEPVADDLMAAQATGTDRIELYTEPYAVAHRSVGAEAALPFARAAAFARSMGLGVNAGHDLDRSNLTDFVTHVPHVLEVSIGHALISDALYLGLEATVRAYLDALGNRK